jgi:enoyl-CoA hydratase/carnithine racemase
MEMLLSGDPISAEQALAWGLVNHVYAAEELLDKALALASKVSQKAPVASRLIQKGVYEGLDKTLRQGLRLEAQLFGEVFQTEDKDEGIQAFIAKRAPEFKGR